MNNIVILGCPRSGTSLTANLVRSAGYDLDFGGTKNLMRPNPKFNPDGYFERWDIVKLNDRLLHHIHPDCSFLNPPSVDKVKNFTAIVNDELEETSHELRSNLGWSIKDSRLAFTFHLYNIFACRFIKVVRNQDEVKQSMIRHYGNMFEEDVVHDGHYVPRQHFHKYYDTVNRCIDFQINKKKSMVLNYDDIMSEKFDELETFLDARVDKSLAKKEYRNYEM